MVKRFLKWSLCLCSLVQAEKGLKAQLAALTEQSSKSLGVLQEKERGLQQLQAQLQKTQASLEQEKQKLESQVSELQETITKKVSRAERSHSAKGCIFLSSIRLVILDRMRSYQLLSLGRGYNGSLHGDVSMASWRHEWGRGVCIVAPLVVSV